jgi:hypothetical protein
MFTMPGSKSPAERKRMFTDVYSKSNVENSASLQINITCIFWPIVEYVDFQRSPDCRGRIKQEQGLYDVLNFCFDLRLKNGTNFVQNPKEAEEF